MDSLVFVDDNPAERALVRRELPMVAMPELPEDPAYYVDCLSRAGYFEALTLTTKTGTERVQYRANLQRDEVRHRATDVDSFLSGLSMGLAWRPFATEDLTRVVRLIDKTNQFNLTTRRYLDLRFWTCLSDPRSLTCTASSSRRIRK